MHELVHAIKPEMTGTYIALRAPISFIVGLLIYYVALYNYILNV